MEKYHIRKDDSVILENPSPQDVEKELDEINRVLKISKRQSKNILIVMFMTGLGIQNDGVQALVYNQFDKKTGQVKVLMAERKLRSWVELYPNSYIISIFACD